ncbi:hypothetical protein RBG11_004222 [Vibrio parahaemolyticus]|nr:hypothetical protein [Vibrio parahaemolyticus]
MSKIKDFVEGRYFDIVKGVTALLLLNANLGGLFIPDAHWSIYVISILSSWTSLYLVFSALTGFPYPYVLLQQNKSNPHFTNPFVVALVWPLYIADSIYNLNLGKQDSIYRRDALKSEPHLFEKMSDIKRNIALGYLVHKMYALTKGWGEELNRRYMAVENMDEMAKKHFTYYEDGHEFGVFKIDMTHIIDGKRFHTIRCGTCGKRFTVDGEIISTRMLTNCFQHHFLPMNMFNS